MLPNNRPEHWHRNIRRQPIQTSTYSNLSNRPLTTTCPKVHLRQLVQMSSYIYVNAPLGAKKESTSRSSDATLEAASYTCQILNTRGTRKNVEHRGLPMPLLERQNIDFKSWIRHKRQEGISTRYLAKHQCQILNDQNFNVKSWRRSKTSISNLEPCIWDKKL